MDRRGFLAAIGMLGLAGCTGDGGTSGTTASPTATSSPTENPQRSHRSLQESVTSDGIRVTATNATVARQIASKNDIFRSFDGVYLLAHVNVKNVGSEPTTLPSTESFSAISGSNQYEPILTGGYSQERTTLKAPASGKTYAGGEEVHPDISSEGWLIFKIPNEFGQITLGYSFTEQFGDDAVTGYWDLPVKRNDAAHLRNLTIDGPESATWGDKVTYTVSANNIGNRAATVIYEAGFGDPDSFSGIQTERSYFVIPPGESKATTFEKQIYELKPIFFKFNDYTQKIEVNAADLTFGETLTTPSGVDIRFGQQRSEPYYKTKGDEERELAPDGYWYSFVNFSAENKSNENQSIPDESVIFGDGQAYGSTTGGYYGEPVLVEPVIGPWITIPWNLDAGERISGWQVHKIAADLSEDDLELRLRNTDGQTVAKWSH